MDTNKLDRRNAAMDIIRIVAVLTVISVHFFLNNGFYGQNVIGKDMYIMCVMRTLFSICVPLFIILTGYLMSHKTLSKKYYLGIRKTLMIYLLASFACMIFRVGYSIENYTVKSAILAILGFEGAPYSWYIEMYIGLFLIIPFLNLAYNKLENKRQKQILVGTLILLTILPSLFNIYNFESAQWWAAPTMSDQFSKLIPSWWVGFYPVAYYFTGCYLREYGLKMKTRTILLLFVMSIVIFGSFNYYRSYGTTFKTGSYVYWYGCQPFVMSVLLFAMLSRIKGDRIPRSVKWLLWKVSDLVLSIYLVSYIFDVYAYGKLKEAINSTTFGFKYYFVMVPLIFICSLLLAIVLAIIEKLIYISASKIWEIIKSIKNDASINKQTLLFIYLIALAVIFAFWKCFYGFGGDDEAFYLTIPHRLSMGDALIKDEWHLSQLSGFLLMPLVGLYRLIMHSTDGIILAARFTYVILHAAVSIFAYSRLKKYGYISVFASVLYFLFTPYDIMALSYNTMALDLLVLSGVLMATYDSQKKLPFILSGVFFAGAVLCCPYLAAVYLIYGVCVIVHIILVKKNRTKTLFAETIFSGKTFLLFTGGAAILAAIFLIYLFTKISISDISANIHGMFADPEHPQIGFKRKMQLYFEMIYKCHPQFKISIITYGIMLIAMIIDRNRKNHRSFYLISSCVIAIFSYILFVPALTYKYYNALIFPMIFVGLTSYILCDKKPKKLFASLFMLGIMYSVCVCFSSNQYFYVISMATAITNIASFVFLGVLLREMKERNDDAAYGRALRYASLIMASFTIILLGAFQIKAKANHCFWESGTPSTLTARIENGPAKGIHTSNDNAAAYENMYRDLYYYKGCKPDNILVMSGKTWSYLALDDFSYGTYSAWLSGEDSSLVRLEEYYSLNPDKIPVYIYMPKTSKYDFASIIAAAQSKGYWLSENDISYKLTKTEQ